MPVAIFACRLHLSVVYCVQGQRTAVIWWGIPSDAHITTGQLNTSAVYNRG